ncbi:MAG: hypothetical protein QE271_01905 [Bacteriovoracaceae bacterium]|nr:hypothetical protein [Bacteriovoracaceae bacterium]
MKKIKHFFFRKKKILNIKYKSSPSSERLVDKQLSVSDRKNFRIKLKNSTYYFKSGLVDQHDHYLISPEDGREIRMDFDRPLKLQQPDGTSAYFTLHEDFLYFVNKNNGIYLIIALILHVMVITFAFNWNSDQPSLETTPDKNSEY